MFLVTVACVPRPQQSRDVGQVYARRSAVAVRRRNGHQRAAVARGLKQRAWFERTRNMDECMNARDENNNIGQEQKKQMQVLCSLLIVTLVFKLHKYRHTEKTKKNRHNTPLYLLSTLLY